MIERRQRQQDAIHQLLLDARGGWVPLPELMKLAAQYNARIYSLRRDGHRIENRTEIVSGERYSWFRLLPETGPATPLTSVPVGTEVSSSATLFDISPDAMGL